MREQEQVKIIISEKYSTATPAMPDKEYKAFKHDIQVNGLRDAIVINQNGVLLDGHHRYRAIKELGHPLKWLVREFENEDEEMLYVLRCALFRKHYDEGQKALIALEMKPYISKLAREHHGRGRKLSSFGESINTEKELANIAGVGQGTIYRAEQVKKTAEENPDYLIDYKGDKKSLSELFDDVKNGKERVAGVSAALNKDIRRQKKKLEALEAAKKLKLSEKIILLNKDCTDIDSITEVTDESVDLIITDPPYAVESRDSFNGLAKLAVKKLKPGGSVVFYSGQYQLFDIMKVFSEYKELTYWWVFAVTHEQEMGTRIHKRAVTVDWKPMLWYVKGNKRLTDWTLHDHIQSSVPFKHTHPWAQSHVEAEYITKNLTISENSVVLDPFLGSGQFAIPAIKLGRYFIGIEIDKDTFEDAKNRITIETQENTGV